MAKALLMTLGTGRDVENGLAKSIQTHNPDKLYFIATNVSLDTIPRIEAAIGHPLQHESPLQVENAEDVEASWKTTAEAIRSILAAGFKAEDITLDFTSGTKAMSAGAVLAGVSLQCGWLSYVGGGKRDDTGRVITGTERVITLTPNQVFLENRRRLFRDLFNAFQYEACLSLVREARKGNADPDLQDEMDAVENLALAYSCWDKFDHSTAAAHFQKVPRTWNSRWRIDAAASKEMVFKIDKQRTAYKNSNQIRDKYGPEILADLLANAARRAVEGKYDDAVARLYRAMELTAQALLAQKDIDTSDVNLEQLPGAWQHEYQGSRKPIQLGQEKAFELLKDTGQPKGNQFLENKRLRNYLSKRNSSILAHGLDPVGKETYDHLRQEVNEMAVQAFPGLAALLDKCRFPPLDVL